MKAKLLFDHPENMSHAGADRGLFTVALVQAGRLVFAGFAFVINAPAYAQMMGATPLFITTVTGIGKDNSIIRSQQLGQFMDVGDIGRRGGQRVHSAGIDIGADMDLHAKISLLAFSGLMLVLIRCFIFVLGGGVHE